VPRVRTVDQQKRRVLDFWRCAMLPLRDGGLQTGHGDELEVLPAELNGGALRAVTAGLRLDAYRDAVPAPYFADLAGGMVWRIEDGDMVSTAPELARLSLNVTMAHHDRGAACAGGRLVHGGHTIGSAAGQATRALPNLVMIAGCHGRDHLAPVYEEDTLDCEVELERHEPPADGGSLVHLRPRVRALRNGGARDDVRDWRSVGVMA
jgi:acyl dehydratase